MKRVVTVLGLMLLMVSGCATTSRAQSVIVKEIYIEKPIVKYKTKVVYKYRTKVVYRYKKKVVYRCPNKKYKRKVIYRYY